MSARAGHRSADAETNDTQGRDARRTSLSVRYFAGQAAVIAVMTASMIVVSVLVGPGVFHQHMTEAGQGDAHVVALHAEEAFVSSAWITLSAGLTVGVLAALVMSLFSAHRLGGSLRALTDASRAVSAGRYDVRLGDPHAGAEIAALAESFNDMADTIRVTESTRRRMLTDLAHEIRTPLASLDACLEGLEAGVLTADEQTLGTLRTQSQRLARLTDDIRDVSAAEEGRLALRPRRIDPGDLVDQARLAAEAAFERAGVRLEVTGGRLPAIDADPDRLAQVLTNLLSNALRHTPRGGRVTLAAGADARGVTFVVEDTGSGIEPDALDHVFERFFRADTARDRHHGGSGVGLTISRAIARAHGGELTALSPGPGRGATFTLTLPAP